MMRTILSFSLLLSAAPMQSQLTLDECQCRAQANYPLARRYELIAKARQYDLSNAGKAYLPQFSLSGKASYQSDITRLPIDLPDLHLRTASKDQYLVMLELRQTLWDGGGLRSTKRLTAAASQVEQEKQNVDMYTLKDRVNQCFFGILLLDERLRQNRLLLEDLARTHRQVSHYLSNGIATPTDLDAVRVEQLHTRQQRIELETSRQVYLQILSAFIGEELPPETLLSKPLPEGPDHQPEPLYNRPEMRWFDAQEEQLKLQQSALNMRLMPHFTLFAQGAYGNPGLNMLKNEFNAYYVAGVHMSWNFGSLYTLKNDRRLLDNTYRRIEANREVFLFNTRLEATQQSVDMLSMSRQMRDDDEIIRLRGNIRRTAEAKVENGTLTVTDLLREIMNESLARQAKALHEMRMLMLEASPPASLPKRGGKDSFSD